MRRTVQLRALLASVLIFALASCAARSAPPSARVPFEAAALDAEADDVYVRIVDVGPGLCAVIRIPGGHSMVYDAGHWNGQHCITAVRELVPGPTIDLMIISHSDADHLGDGFRILSEKHVLQTILAGEPRATDSFRDLMKALGKEVEEGGTVHNLQSVGLTPGRTIPLGEAMVTLIAGWPRWTDLALSESERRNAISIVVRLEYRGRSILFTGDTVGRRLTDFDDACKDAEKVMVDRHSAGEVSLKADVLVASHHGANNGSASCFIQAVDPEFVIFSAGHQHHHPTKAAADRFLAHGVEVERIFRTDLGDSESGTLQWNQGSIEGCSDPAGDDDVEVVLRADGALELDYLRVPQGCDSRGGS